MTLGTHFPLDPYLQMSEVSMSRDARAQELGRMIKNKRLDLGLNRPAFVREMARHGEEITPDYLNKLESGAASLARASLGVREGIRIVLGYSREDWFTATGLYAGDVTSAQANTGNSLSPDQTGGKKLNRRAGDIGPTISVDIIRDFIEIPVYGSASAGSPVNFPSEANVIAHEIIPRTEYRNGNTLAMYATGDSMSPTIEDGELVVADKSLTDLQDGLMYFVYIEGQGVCVKRALALGNSWWLESDNRTHKPFQAEDAVILGQVYWGQPRGKRYGSRSRPS